MWSTRFGLAACTTSIRVFLLVSLYMAAGHAQLLLFLIHHSVMRWLFAVGRVCRPVPIHGQCGARPADALALHCPREATSPRALGSPLQPSPSAPPPIRALYQVLTIPASSLDSCTPPDTSGLAALFACTCGYVLQPGDCRSQGLVLQPDSPPCFHVALSRDALH